MKISDVIECLEDFAPLSLQEDYDNAGLLVEIKTANAQELLPH